MHARERDSRHNGFYAAIAATLVLSTLFLPLAQAQAQADVRSVGSFLVDAQGKASGENVAAEIIEAQGTLEGYTSLALGATIFDSVSIEGFTQVEKIHGVGSSSLVLRGSNAVVSLYDNSYSAFKVQATQGADVAYDLSSGMTADVAADGHIATVTDASGAYIGSLVVTGASGEASGQSRFTGNANGNVAAHLASGDQLVFRAEPVYAESRAQGEATARLLAEGWLTTDVVTEFDASATAQTTIEYAADVHTETEATLEGTVETEVQSRAEGSAVIHYDLAYESLTVESAEDVAVYADGKLATRVESVAEVQEHAEAGSAAYFATKAEGRTQVVASTPDFHASASHKLTVAASAHASAKAHTEAQAKAELRARAEANVQGEFNVHADGKVTGEFSTAVVAEAEGEIHAYTNLETRTEVFANAKVEGEAWAKARLEGSSRLVLEGEHTTVTLVDDAHATLLLDAKAEAEATFQLAAGVRAHASSATEVTLTGPNGYAGSMVIVNADGSAAAGSRFETNARGEVKAHLEANARVVARAEANARASATASVIAEATAHGELGAEATAGFEGSAVASTTVEWYNTVDLEATTAAKGDFHFDFETSASAAASLVFESRGGALSAKAASDVQVTVNGRAATQVSSAQAALRAEGHAAYYAETTWDGDVRVLVNTNVEANARADVRIWSKLEADAQANARADAFGEFKLYYDGSAVGSYVSLKADTEAGVVTDYTMATTGTKVFTSMQAGASGYISAGGEGTSTLVLENQESRLEISDTTSAHMKLVAKAETQASFQVASSVHATAKGGSVVELSGPQGYLASMVITDVEGKASAESRFAVEASGEVRAHLEANAQIVFKSHVGIETELSAEQRTMINQAIASGHVGGQVLVQSSASLAARAHAAAQAQAEARARLDASANAEARSVLTAEAAASGRVTAAITASYYSDVQLVTAATTNRVDVTVSSTTSAGKTIIVSLDPATISGMAEGHAEILVDGEAAVQAESYADVLNPDDDAGASEYFVLAGDAGTQVLVSIAHFSTRTVTLKSAEPAPPPLFLYATMFLGVVVAIETVYIARKRS